MPDMPDMMGGMAGWMMALMFLIPLHAIVLVAALIAWTIRSGRAASRADAPEKPLATIQRRYARGDLGTEEYERMRADLAREQGAPRATRRRMTHKLKLELRWPAPRHDCGPLAPTPGTDIHGFAASAMTPNTFYAYVVGSGLFKSANAGKSWQKAGDASSAIMSMTVAKSGGADPSTPARWKACSGRATAERRGRPSARSGAPR